MHIVIAGWIYVIAMIALAMRSTFAAIVTFAVMGCGPVALYAWIVVARHARRRDAAAREAPPRRAGAVSGLEREVHAGDDRDA
jgi:threonine dehydrogenase-like Zn-dependent dehydrogenase